MASQHALIVDDSKTAQLRLKRLLEIYELEIDVAASAEEALAYLSYRVPAVIFLDQSMQGMDGIQALRTIKTNPSTATIPVIMYTSEKGQVFTSQARALGALDILNKGSLAPSSLDGMLRRLNILPRKKFKTNDVEPKNNLATEPDVSGRGEQRTSKAAAQPNLGEIQQQIARLFEIHIADVSRQISKSTQFLGKRLQAQTESNTKTPVEVVIGDVPLDVINKEVSAERRRIAVISNGLLGVVLLALVVAIGLMINLSGKFSTLQENFSEIAAASKTHEQYINRLEDTLAGINNNGSRSNPTERQLLNTLTWITNTDFGFAENEEPLGENMVSRLQQLISYLRNIGYEGVINVNINFGNTCMARSAAGDLVVAPDKLPILDCILRAATEEVAAPERYLTVGFVNFQQGFPELRDHRITLTLNSIGFDNPRLAYPFIGDDTNAGDWNHVAAQNNYLYFSFQPYD